MLYLLVPPGQYKCEYRDKLIGRAFLSEEGAVIVTGKTGNEKRRTSIAMILKNED